MNKVDQINIEIAQSIVLTYWFQEGRWGQSLNLECDNEHVYTYDWTLTDSINWVLIESFSGFGSWDLCVSLKIDPNLVSRVKPHFVKLCLSPSESSIRTWQPILRTSAVVSTLICAIKMPLRVGCLIRHAIYFGSKPNYESLLLYFSHPYRIHCKHVLNAYCIVVLNTQNNT